MKTKDKLLLTGLVVLLLCSLYVWPGVWRYSYYEKGSYDKRSDKLTGQVQLWKGRWVLDPK